MSKVWVLKGRLTVMNFLEFAVWGAYLTSMGRYLSNVGLSENIGWFYAMQGVVSLFMPALLGIVADRWIPAQRLLGFCHLLAALFMGCAAWYAGSCQDTMISVGSLFTLYSLSVAFYMPTLALTNSVAYSALSDAGLDTVKHFPPIRVFGTVGFICSMVLVDLLGFQTTYMQFYLSSVLGIILALYAQTLPACQVSKTSGKSLVEALGLNAFLLFKQRKMAVFFIFSMLLGVSLQITNGFANPFIGSFEQVKEYADTFGANHANILISISQISETFCILLIPFFLKRFGIKCVMQIAMLAWVLRFGFFAVGNPGSGVWLFILSMLVYGVAFDFFNVSGSLYVDKETDPHLRSSAQGLFFMMTNGIGSTIGTLAAQAVVNKLVNVEGLSMLEQIDGWRMSWGIFAAYAFVVFLLFSFIFKQGDSVEKCQK